MLSQGGEHQNQIILYEAADGSLQVQVRLQDETVCLSLMQMVDLFQKDKRTVSEHVQKLYEEGELERNPTVRNFRAVRGMQFRLWATQRLCAIRVSEKNLYEKVCIEMQKFLALSPLTKPPKSGMVPG